MAERKRRRRRKRGRFSGLYKLLSFLVIFTALLVGSVAFFRVNKIVVTGNSRYTEEEVIAAAGVQTEENLLLVNREQSAISITQSLPYVEQVVVIKKLPDTVELRLTESPALAALEAGGSWWLINQQCKFLEQGTESLRGNLPRLLGLTPVSPAVAGRLTVDQESEGEKRKLAGLKNLLAALEERELLDSLAEFIDLSSGNIICFGFGTELTVKLPMNGDFNRRILSLYRVVETFQERGERLSGTLDLTYGDQTARLLPVRWLPGDPLESGDASDGESVESSESPVPDASALPGE